MSTLLWLPTQTHTPSPARNSSKSWKKQLTPNTPQRASPEEQAALKELRKKHRLSVVALEQLRFCRQHLDRTPGGRQRWLIDVVDGGYSNRTFFVAGQVGTLHDKEVPLLCWPKVTQARPLRLILIRAAGYRLCQGS
ncbi:MAG: hypothetical protein HY674_07400, partial [Chloroflexi bacterium]|nr:hypothetical protein [Chloroflexota bacterium]